MKILYDYQTFGEQKYGGISNSFVRLIENLPQGYDYEIAVLESDNVHLSESKLHVKCVPRKLYEDIFLSRRKFFGRGLLYRTASNLIPSLTSLGINRAYSIEALKKGDYDVFHPTFFHPYFLKYLKGKPFVLTVHDMIPELFFNSRDLQITEKPKLCKAASHIIAVSEKTKYDLMEMLHIPDSKITVIYHGAPDSYYELTSKAIIEGRYILYVGQRHSYKSFMPMMKGLSEVLKQHIDIQVVCTGPDLTTEEILFLRRMGMDNRVTHLRVSDAELANLYRYALCFIFPSVYEGFGIPILEAYSAHCPVLLNYASCFPEIAQDAAIYFHLNDSSSDLKDVMEQFLNMSEDGKTQLISRQLQRLQHFSWKKSAQKLAHIYMMVSERL